MAASLFRGTALEFKQVGTRDTIGTLNPLAHATPPRIRGGQPLARLFNGQPFWFDPLQYHQMDLTGGTSVLVVAERGVGKTSLMMRTAGLESPLRNTISGHRRRVYCEDTRFNLDEEGNKKAEYKPLIEDHLGGVHTDLSRYRLNPLDAKMGMDVEEQSDVMKSLLGHVSDEGLGELEKTALSVGLGVMEYEAPEEASPNMLQQIVESQTFHDYQEFQRRMRDPVLASIKDEVRREKMRKRFEENSNCDPEEFARASSRVSDMLVSLIVEYGGIFGAEHSIFDLLTQPVVGVDLTKVREDALPLVEMVLWAWRSSALDRGDLDLAADVEIHDENWSRWGSLIYGKHMVRHLKHIRQRDTRIWRAMHRLSDLDQVGRPGSPERQQALTGMAETDIVFIGKTPRRDHAQIQEVFREIPQQYLNALPTLGKGQFLVLIGQTWPIFPIQVPLTAKERKVTYTDRARDMQLA